MSFNREDQVEDYARQKYPSTAANIFALLCKKRDHEFFWGALEKGLGFGSNSPNLSTPVELPELYEDFGQPPESYGHVSFWLDFDTDFDLEERMDLIDFKAYLMDACKVFCDLYPEEKTRAEAAHSKAIARIEEMIAVHQSWKKLHKTS